MKADTVDMLEAFARDIRTALADKLDSTTAGILLGVDDSGSWYVYVTTGRTPGAGISTVCGTGGSLREAIDDLWVQWAQEPVGPHQSIRDYLYSVYGKKE